MHAWGKLVQSRYLVKESSPYLLLIRLLRLGILCDTVPGPLHIQLSLNFGRDLSDLMAGNSP